MSQIDRVIYLPLLFWFWVLLFILYIILFSYFLSAFFYVYRTRLLFFNEMYLSLRGHINFIENSWYTYSRNKKKNKLY